MRNHSLLVFTVASLLIGLHASQAQRLVVSVRGTVSYETTVNGRQKVVTHSFTDADILGQFGYTSKTGAVVFNATDYPSLEVDTRGTTGDDYAFCWDDNYYSVFQSTSPNYVEYFGPLSSNSSDLSPTTFEGFAGSMKVTESLNSSNNLKAVSGTIMASSTATTPVYYYSFTFSGSKAYVAP